MATVSVPEKTLEHWASIYLAYRYRSHASMWWPTAGVDIDVRSFPAQPGKAVQLELKTTVVAGADFQDVLVNLGQLWNYSQLPLAKQPYYVFPWPHWTGELEYRASLAGIPPTELAYKRSGADWWFADWMVVLTTAQVAKVLSRELVAHGSSTRKGASCRLVRFDFSAGTGTPRRTWGPHATEPLTVPWRRFWTGLQACGQDGWPQLIRVPERLVTKSSYGREEVRGLLASSLTFMANARESDIEFMTLGPRDETSENEPDVFVAMPEEFGGIPSELATGPHDQEDIDRRQAVFVHAGARRSSG